VSELDPNRQAGGDRMTESVTETEQLSDKEHFEAIVRRYQSALLRYVRTTVGEHDAQDVVQDVFLRLHKAMRENGLRDIANLGTWLFRVAHNCAADVLRRKGVDERARESIGSDAPGGNCDESGGLDEMVHREDCKLAFRLLDKLTPQQKQVILLKVAQGMSYREICDVTGLPLGTVGFLMNQGLGRLARELKAAGAI